VKVFPASSLGPEFIAAVRAPLADIPLVAVGGVALTDVPAYLAAGATAVAIGRPVLGNALSGDRGPDALRDLRARAVQFVAAAADHSI
jgi:2-dehydro-3-deoxyphosphogluconate aldolase/(4S)-4-hydroxy-2-oxoglutarate aldolase